MRAFFIGALLLSTPLWAGGGDALEQVRDRLRTNLEEIDPTQVRSTPAPGLFEVQDGMAFGYVTSDGRYLVEGQLIDLETGTDLTEQRRDDYRAERIAGLADRSIEFAPVDRKIRHRVHVFIDVDCEYCTDLHREVPQMNQDGVAVNYLFYPRRGEHSRGYELAEKAWCAEDPRKALTRLFEGRELESNRKCANPVNEQLAAALELGVRGTPMIVLPGGKVHYGYVTADRLAKILDEIEASPEADTKPRRSGPRK